MASGKAIKNKVEILRVLFPLWDLKMVSVTHDPDNQKRNPKEWWKLKAIGEQTW